MYTTQTRVYSTAGITSTVIPTTDVDEAILEATEQINQMVKTTFETRQVSFTLDGNGRDTLFLKHYPLITLDSLTIDGTSVTTSTVYKYINEGKIVLGTDSEVAYFTNSEPQQVVVQYTYGYNYVFTDIGISANPEAYLIRKLASHIAAMMILIQQIGGTYNDVTSYSIPEFTASKGEPYTNIRETVARLDNSIKFMLNSTGFRSLCANVAIS